MTAETAAEKSRCIEACISVDCNQCIRMLSAPHTHTASTLVIVEIVQMCVKCSTHDLNWRMKALDLIVDRENQAWRQDCSGKERKRERDADAGSECMRTQARSFLSCSDLLCTRVSV